MVARPSPFPTLLPDEAATRALAGRLAALARPPDVITLSGDLGAGKTSFARAFIQARAGRSLTVPSPTFTLVQTYPLDGGEIRHFDLYRLVNADEALELDIEDAFATAISLIEWPDRLDGRLPTDRLDLAFRHGDRPDARMVQLDPGPSWTERFARLSA